LACPNCGSHLTELFEDCSGQKFEKCKKCPYVFGPVDKDRKLPLKHEKIIVSED